MNRVENRSAGSIKYHSAFDIIGPVMVGPSSSHTAGALRLAHLARVIFGHQPTVVEFQLMGSFAETYRGHGTDRALGAGILGFGTDDGRLPEALEVARQQGMTVEFSRASGSFYHPNTVRIIDRSRGGGTDVIGSSLGGGKVEIVEVDSFPVRISGDRYGVLLWHADQPGFLAEVLGMMAGYAVNVARLSLERARRGETALAAIEIDDRPPAGLQEAVTAMRAGLRQVRWIAPV